MIAVLSGYLIGWLFESFLVNHSPIGDLRVIGYIVPGLIANDMIRQGITKTLLATLLASAIVRLMLIAFVM